MFLIREKELDEKSITNSFRYRKKKLELGESIDREFDIRSAAKIKTKLIYAEIPHLDSLPTFQSVKIYLVHLFVLKKLTVFYLR